jgi:hypothetical protein
MDGTIYWQSWPFRSDARARLSPSSPSGLSYVSTAGRVSSSSGMPWTHRVYEYLTHLSYGQPIALDKAARR